MIPKIVHYVWLGNGKKSPIVNQCMESWKVFLSDYEIREWSDKDLLQIPMCHYALQAYELKKWAFVSDYIRLLALYEYGGLYFDTDFEVFGNLDSFLDCDGFFCAESRHTISTAIIAAKPKAPWIKAMLDEYEKLSFILENGNMNQLPNTKRVQKYLENTYGYCWSNEVQTFMDGLRVYPADFFSPLNCFTGLLKRTNRTVGMHHYDNTWKSSKDKIKKRLMQIGTRIIGEDNRARLVHLFGG